MSHRSTPPPQHKTRLDAVLRAGLKHHGADIQCAPDAPVPPNWTDKSVLKNIPALLTQLTMAQNYNRSVKEVDEQLEALIYSLNDNKATLMDAMLKECISNAVWSRMSEMLKSHRPTTQQTKALASALDSFLAESVELADKDGLGGFTRPL